MDQIGPFQGFDLGRRSGLFELLFMAQITPEDVEGLIVGWGDGSVKRAFGRILRSGVMKGRLLRWVICGRGWKTEAGDGGGSRVRRGL
jgi:hypothetical protein